MEQVSQSQEEVVLTYHPPAPQEVVLTYRAPVDPARAKIVRREDAQRKRKQRRRKALAIFIGSIVVGIIAATLLIRAYNQSVLEDKYSYSVDTAGLPVDIPLYDWTPEGVRIPLKDPGKISLTPQVIYRNVSPATVTVLADTNSGGVSMGSGVIFSKDGFLVTNYHVVQNSNDCSVLFENGVLEQAYYIGGDAENDLAVLKLAGNNYPMATFGQSDYLSVGDSVYAIGSPLQLDLQGTFTNGMVAALGREMDVNDRHMSELIQTNVALNTGNSGGPLINEYGQVVGLNTMKISSDEGTIEGIAFSISSATVERIVWDLTAYGEVQPQPTLGVTVGSQASQTGDGRWGSLVHDVIPDSAAGVAGVQPGDIVLFAGEENILTSDDVLRARRQYRIGDQFPMTIYRGGRDIHLTLELDA